MPELPEVESIRLELSKQILNKKITDVIVRQRKLRWEIPQNLRTKLLNQQFQSIIRRGKYLILQFSKNNFLLLHLGMSGKLFSFPKNHQTLKHEHLTIAFADNTILSFIDPRKFGAVLLIQNDPMQHSLLKLLGPEPFSPEFNAEYLYSVAQNKKINAKQFLMNSKIVVGVGNIYANEILFLAKIHPKRQARDLSKNECAKIVKIISEILQKAIKFGGTTIRDFANSYGNAGNFQQYLQVYGRGGLLCVNCNNKLTEIKLGQRSTVFCTICQK